MSKLRQKSEFNITSAKILLDKALYAPSIHCSYYSCFQLLKYTIKEIFGEDYETQANKIFTSKQRTHKYVITYITNELNKSRRNVESRNFKNKLKDLQHYRIESDYENVEVDSDKGNKAYDIAVELRNYILKILMYETQRIHKN